MAQSIVTLRVDTTNATAALQGVQKRTNKLQNSFNGLKTAIAGIGIGLLAKEAVQTSTNFEKLNVRLGLLTKANGTFAKSQQIAADAQKAFGLSATEALEGITDITARLAPLGVGVDDIKSTFFGFNTAAKLAGASTIEASNAFRQLAQALGSGRLAGDEFRSISEQIPTLLAPIADELNVPIGKLKELAAEGKLTSEVVLRSLRTVETDGAASLKALIENDPTQVFKDLSNATEDLKRAVGDQLVPALIPAVKLLTELTKAAADFVNSPFGQTSLIFTGIAVAAKTAASAVALLKIAFGGAAGTAGALAIAMNAIPFVGLITAAGLATTAFIKFNKQKKQFNELTKTGPIEDVNKALKEQNDIVTKLTERENAARGREKRALKRQLDEAKANKKALEDRLNVIKQEEEAVNKIVKLKKGKKEEEQKLNDIQRKHHEQIAAQAAKERDELKAKNKNFAKFIAEQKQSKELLQAAIDGNVEEVRLQHAINEAVKEHGEHNRQKITDIFTANQKLKDQKIQIDKNEQAADKLKEKFMEIGKGIEQGIVSNLTNAVMGTQTLAQAAMNVLENLKRKLIEVAIQRAVSGIGNFFGGALGGIFGGLFANGGRPPVGKASIVGERGPEIFIPSVSGTVIPNNKIGGAGSVNNIVINVDASGSSVEGNESEGRQLGVALSAAIESELIKQKRAGGLLA